jgi:hypothetical protein
MREILFRGKTEAGFWEYGYYTSNAGEEHFIEKWDSFRQEMIFTPVLPETVGQYTGYIDNNVVKIFEGDIVRWKLLSGEITRGTVEFANAYFLLPPGLRSFMSRFITFARSLGTSTTIRNC